MIRFEQEESHIRMKIIRGGSPVKIDMHLRKNKTKGIAINGVPIRKASELFGVANFVFFSPEDLNIIKNGPGERRRFVDMELCQLSRVVDKHFNGDLVRVVHLYYDRLMRMVELGGFDIVGHADKMHYNASAYHPGLLDEPWYDALIQEYFDAIARKGYIVEINTKSYLELGTFYPNERYFPVLLEKGIRVQVNSDSHYPERINNGRLQALMALQASGYHTVTEMYNNEWKDMPLIIHT